MAQRGLCGDAGEHCRPGAGLGADGTSVNVCCLTVAAQSSTSLSFSFLLCLHWGLLGAGCLLGSCLVGVPEVFWQPGEPVHQSISTWQWCSELTPAAHPRRRGCAYLRARLRSQGRTKGFGCLRIAEFPQAWDGKTEAGCTMRVNYPGGETTGGSSSSCNIPVLIPTLLHPQDSARAGGEAEPRVCRAGLASSPFL